MSTLDVEKSFVKLFKVYCCENTVLTRTEYRRL